MPYAMIKVNGKYKIIQKTDEKVVGTSEGMNKAQGGDEIKQIYIWPDFGASGIWVPDEERGMVCYDYSDFDLSPELLQRFKYWMEWYDGQSPEMSDVHNKMDWDLFHSYGKSIATEVKLLFKEKYQVFYGYSHDKDLIEITLEDRLNYGGMTVPLVKRRS